MNSRFRHIYHCVMSLIHQLTVLISPEIEINRYFRKVFGHKANLISPRSLIEKIYWMQLHCDTKQWSLFADKYRMREYVISKGFGDNLPILYGMWTDPNEIDINKLPKKFVMKANNGCATVSVIKDKSQVEWVKKKREMKKWLSIPFGYSGYEPHYLRIKPCIIAEELLEQNDELKALSPSSMVDYKFWCFNGHVECCFVAYNRRRGNLTIDLYDTNWNRLLKYIKNYKSDRCNPSVIIPRPECLDKMVEIASALSIGQPQMRVDFYIVANRPVVGELTMSSGYGYFTEEYYNYLGTLVDVNLLPKIK